MIVLIVEDGTGVIDANTYVSLAEAESYFASRLNSDIWNAAGDNKAVALVSATRMLDAVYDFVGIKSYDSQSLSWPRDRVPDPDGDYFPSDQIIKAVKNATCEQALAMLTGDRTAESDTKGITSVNLGRGALQVAFDSSDRAQPITDLVAAILAPFGTRRGGSGGYVRMTRV